jgi:orotidine-5'-phosphate decarboxylase
MQHFADRLAAAVQARRNAVCVGLDPRWDALPLEIRRRHGGPSLEAAASAFEEFCSRVIDIVAPLVPVVKPQSAFFEACGPAGLAALQRIIRRARERGLLVLLDSKRNDIASTASAYADAAFGGVTLEGRSYPVWDADALTVNPYLGMDAVEVFLESARRSGRGVFVLVRTSNPGAGQFQDLECNGKPLYIHVAEAVGAWARANVGKSGFGDVGAVVGATDSAKLARVRAALPEALILVPGFGAQGAGAADTASGFRADGLGAIVNNARGIIAGFDPALPGWEDAIVRASEATVRELSRSTPMGKLSKLTSSHD